MTGAAGTEPVELWEQWVGSVTPPVERVAHRAKVTFREGERWISFREQGDGQAFIIEMPSNAPSKSCDEQRHDDCLHRLGGPHEGGVTLKLSLPGFLWRCGCPCHSDPIRAGRLF
jgi:hypothetical protein